MFDTKKYIISQQLALRRPRNSPGRFLTMSSVPRPPGPDAAGKS